MKQILLSINNVTKTYTKSNLTISALKGVSLDIYKGEVFGLLGSNGAGKTTLSSLIATLHPLTSGEICFNGQSIYSNVPQYRLNIGFCPQKPNFEPNLTVQENLIFAGAYFGLSQELIKKRVQFLMQRFELTQYTNSSPAILSGGYKQRLLIARALVHNPALVILDEPTVALDPHIRRQIWDIIKDLKTMGVTVILTTHYLDEAQYLADRICMLDKGKILMVDTPQNLIANHKKANLEEVFIHFMNEQREQL